MVKNKKTDPEPIKLSSSFEDEKPKRGRLKIFLGYAAGVGKTHAMLEAGLLRKEEGVDVVVGYVQTHGRRETEALLARYEKIPSMIIEYRGVWLKELNVNAVLDRKPQLVLVDDLAHYNTSSSQNTRRYLDIKELLAAGIDVYATLNILHLESLNDDIFQVTGIKIRDTIPDLVMDEADEIQLIDLPPEELLVRLREGKVYIPVQETRSSQKIFSKETLTVLRELTITRALERIYDQVQIPMQGKAPFRPLHTAERILVCVAPNLLSERLVRTARNLAEELGAEWQAVFVETPDQNLSKNEHDRINRIILLAEELGAKTATIRGVGVAKTVINYAIQNDVTKIIVGKPLRSRLREFFRPSVASQMIQLSETIDIYVVSGETNSNPSARAISTKPYTQWDNYILALMLVVFTSAISYFFHIYISATNLVMILLLAVALSAVYMGRGPAILVSVVGVAAYVFLFIEPVLTFSITDTEYFITFISLLGVGLLISQLTAQVRNQAEAAERREAETARLYALSRDLAVAEGLDKVLQTIISNVSQTFKREVVIFIPNPEAEEQLKSYPSQNTFAPDQESMYMVKWVFENGEQVGIGTDTLPGGSYRYLPLKTARNIIGVLGIQLEDYKKRFTSDQIRTLEAFAGQAALAIERARLADQAHKAQLIQATEQLQTALLNSISHDLRTPLVTITGTLSSLQETDGYLDTETRKNLLDTAQGEANRLNRLVGDLLSMTRIEAGAIHIMSEPVDVQDVIGTALEQVADRLEDRKISMDLPENLPLVPMDFVLISQVLTNLLDNAAKHTPPGSPIEIKARLNDKHLEIQIADRGPGIPPEDLHRIFDKFYRVHRPDNISGTGLGLAICKGIVEAHGGAISAQNRAGGGAILRFTLPLAPNESGHQGQPQDIVFNSVGFNT